MISRDTYAATLDELADTKQQLAALRAQHDCLRAKIALVGESAGDIAQRAIAESRGRPTQTWQRASAEQAACRAILNSTCEAEA